MQVPEPARRLLRAALRRLGYRLVPIHDSKPAYGLDALLPVLKQRGFTPRHIVDVGANHGMWTRTSIRYFPNAIYTLIEPQDNLKSSVQDLIEQGFRIRWVNAGAADKPEILPFSISNHDYASTFSLKEETARLEGCQQVMVEVRTLDEIVESLDGPLPDMVKIDAEGLDLRVLRGASNLLGKTEIFFLEATVTASVFRPEWENTVSEVVRTMAETGYSLLDVTDLNRSRSCGFLWLVELAFLKNGSALLDGVTYE